MFVWMRSRDGAIDTDQLYKFAVEEKVAFVPFSVFDLDSRDRTAMGRLHALLARGDPRKRAPSRPRDRGLCLLTPAAQRKVPMSAKGPSRRGGPL